MPQGLYRDVVAHKYLYFYLWHFTTFVRWSLMLLQILLGAALTALGSMSLEDGRPITLLGAVNTVVAGLLALLHNSGIPDRYWNDMAEFEEIEDHIKEILDSGIAPAGQEAPQVLGECFDLFRDAKATVAANLPANYASRQLLRTNKPQKTPTPSPAAQPGLSAAPIIASPA
ncbi:hypothetical protein E4U43_001832 [Claviceps pusilla]|uniref:SMODS and SLOG-associating 2TM effector domain-containing protein n=1 Tax=Claviceps pusilla TaxID=123648 RepID=A0A9P7N7Y1_9HYPO|nr:hypothetical protein E4U43_001832 [Claviceps pusilla]